MGFVPKFIYSLMGVKVETPKIPALDSRNPGCPAGFQDITLIDVLDDGEYTACANYGEREKAELLSEEYCPTCPHNPDNIRRRADEKLESFVNEFIKTNPKIISA